MVVVLQMTAGGKKIDYLCAGEKIKRVKENEKILGKMPYNCIFLWQYMLTLFAGGPSLGEENGSQTLGEGGMIEMHNIYPWVDLYITEDIYGVIFCNIDILRSFDMYLLSMTECNILQQIIRF